MRVKMQDQPEQNPAENEAVPIDEMEPETEIDPMVQLQSELEQSREQTLRLAAELENLRKRSERDVTDARRYAVSRFAEDVLGVADNLARALANVTDEVRQQASERMLQLVEGVDMTQKSLQTALGRHGIKQITDRGEKFDHNIHQAVAQIPSTEFGKGMVCEVIQPGYVIGDRTLRAAMVAVSTGPSAGTGAKPVPDAEPGSTIDTKA